VAILYLPQSFLNGGWLFSIFASTVSGIFSLYCILQLLDCRAASGGNSFSEIGELACGTFGKTCVNLSLFFCQLGYPIAFLNFVIVTIHNVFRDAWGIEIHKNYIGFFWFVVFSLLSYVRKLAVFAQTHVFADVMILFMISVVMVWGVMTAYRNGTTKFSEVPLFNPKDYADCFGFSIFAYEGIGLIIPVQDITSDKKVYPFVIKAVVATMVLIFITFGLVCSATFGTKQTHLISDELPANPFIYTLKLLFCLNVTFSYPL
jgi:proton-coupled amino acid transporter